MSKNNRTADRVQTVWNILGGEEGVDRLLRGEITISKPIRPIRSWHEQDGVIYFSVTSNGMTGEEWIEHLEGKNFCVSDYAKSVLRSSDFKPTNGVTTEIAVLKGMLFSDKNLITRKIRAEANRRKLTKPNAEVVCLIREKFTDEEIEAMGLKSIVVMHESIKGSDHVPRLLSVGRHDVDGWLHAFCDDPASGWSRERGFASVASSIAPYA